MVNNESKVEENRDLRILYIDDEQPVRQTLSTFLERSTHAALP
jgi:CheY-like chemotaxis protein